MSDVQFESNVIEVKGAMDEKTIAFLYEAAVEVQSAAQRNTKVKTGETKRHWNHAVDEKELQAHIGSDYDNAVWEEFGTGIYALNGDGRQTPWSYMDEYGEWHTTKGKQARRPLFNALESTKPAIQKRAEEIFKELGG